MINARKKYCKVREEGVPGMRGVGGNLDMVDTEGFLVEVTVWRDLNV